MHRPRNVVRDAWLLAHPTFPTSRPGRLQAIYMGFFIIPQSWHMHGGNSKTIIITEASIALLMSTLSFTVTISPVLDLRGVPPNGMADVSGMANLFYALLFTASLCFAMSMVYSLVMLVVMQSHDSKEANALALRVGQAIHWPVTNWILGAIIGLVAAFLKMYFDVDLWVWVCLIGVVCSMLLVFCFFLGSIVQIQWDAMDLKLSQRARRFEPAENVNAVRSDTVDIGAVHPSTFVSLAAPEPPPQPVTDPESNPQSLNYPIIISGGSFGCFELPCVETNNDDFALVQEWVTRLAGIDDETRERVCRCFQEEYIDMEALVELDFADFSRLGVSKTGWQKHLLRRARGELGSSHFEKESSFPRCRT